MQIGRYTVEHEIGRGSMGIVYLATDPAIDRQVAIKVVNIAALQDPAQEAILRDRLRREARSAAILSHSGIVRVYDTVEIADSTCLVMEYVDGEPLSRLLARDLPPPATAVHLITQAAAALDYAHQHGVIHRDVKPANIIVTPDGTAKIADFGLARVIGRNTTYGAKFLGTPGYMAPEQIRDELLTGASDQFALGAVAYEILTGRRPFDAEAITTLIFKILQDPMPSTGLGDSTDFVLSKAMAKTTAGRFPNCLDFAEALAQTLAIRMVVPGPTIAVRAPIAASPWKAMAGGVLGIAVVLGGAVGLLREPDVSSVTTQTISPVQVEVPAPRMAKPKIQAPPSVPAPRERVPAAPKTTPVEPPPPVEAAPPQPAPIAKKQSTPLPRVLITTTPPGAVLAFDGSSGACVSPCERELPIGTHSVKATMSGHRDTTSTFEVPGPPQVALTLERLQGVIAFDPNLRGATILLDGHEAAVRPPAELLLPAGEHAIKLVAPNGTVVFDRTLTVQHRGRILVRAPDAPPPAATPPPPPAERKVPSLRKRKEQ